MATKENKKAVLPQGNPRDATVVLFGLKFAIENSLQFVFR